MYKSIAKMAGCAFCVFIGLAMIEQAIVDSDGIGSMLFMIATGLLFIVFGKTAKSILISCGAKPTSRPGNDLYMK